MNKLGYISAVALLAGGSWWYLVQVRGAPSEVVLAVLALCGAVMGMVLFVMRLNERANAELVQDLKECALAEAQLYEQVAQAAGAQAISVSTSSISAQVDGLYQGFRFSLATGGVGDDNPRFATIWLSGNAPENWPERLPRRKTAQGAFSPRLPEAWAKLTKLGEVFPDGPERVRGKLAFAPKTTMFSPRMPRDPAIYTACLAALVAVAHELDQGPRTR
jgi:hypothetical protein